LSERNLYDLVASRFPLEVKPEADFTDAVQKNLRNARFMLLVVGDGIRENLEDMLGLLQQQPQMLFTLGLVEMQIYECDGLPGRLIVPQLVARTNEIVRAVVRVENPHSVPITIILPPKEARRTPSEQEFLESVEDPETRDIFVKLIAFAKEFGHVQCATQSVGARMPFHNTGDLRLFRLFQSGTVGVGQSRLDRQLQKRGLPDDLAWTLAKEIAGLFPGVDVKQDDPNLSRRLSAREVAAKFDDFVSVYRRVIDQLKAMNPTTTPTPDEDEPDEDEENVSDQETQLTK